MTLASAGDDGCIWLWDPAKGEGKVRLSWGANYVFCAAWSPDGQAIAAGTQDSLLLLRADSAGWRPVQRWKLHQGWVTCASFSPDGQMLVSGGVDGVVHLWDAIRVSKKPLMTFTGGLGSIRSVKFSPDGHAIAAGGTAGVGIWKASEPEPVLFNRLRDADVRSLAFAPDGRQVVAAAGRCVLSIDSLTHRGTEVLHAAANYFRCLAFVADGSMLALGCDDGSVRLWDVPSSEERCVLGGTMSCVGAIAASPDGKWIAASCDDFVIRVWDLQRALSDEVL